ncbi:hypothetical protein WJX84_003154 [Apatococcus fuscideae]|uniref:Uncharacterized protein n=1 Tax=Apatococcus fuscideae TaxID=2026836 RepID=A0AAW1SUN9_9CHLO
MMSAVVEQATGFRDVGYELVLTCSLQTRSQRSDYRQTVAPELTGPVPSRVDLQHRRRLFLAGASVHLVKEAVCCGSS